MPRGGQTLGKINLGLSRTAHTPAGRRDNLGRNPAIGCGHWHLGQRHLGERLYKRRGQGGSVSGVFSRSPPAPLPALTVGGGEGKKRLRAEPAPQALPCQAQVVRRMHGARHGGALEPTVIRAATTGEGFREGGQGRRTLGAKGYEGLQ